MFTQKNVTKTIAKITATVSFIMLLTSILPFQALADDEWTWANDVLVAPYPTPDTTNALASSYFQTSDGNFVVLWLEGTTGPGTTYGRAQKINPNATDRDTDFELWSAGGEIIVNGWMNFSKAVPDDSGGFFLVWTNQSDGHIRAQHVDTSGNLLWGANGIEVSTTGTISYLDRLPSITPDGAGGLYVAWEDFNGPSRDNAYIAHVNSTPTVAWTHQITSPSGSSNERDPQVITDEAKNNVYVMYEAVLTNPEHYIAKYSSAGTVTTGGNWGSGEGVQVSDYVIDGITIVPDGSDGAVIAKYDSSDWSFRLQRMDSNGNLLWGSGTSLVTDPANEYPLRAFLLHNSDGSTTVVWDGYDYNSSSEQHVFAQKVNSSGTLLWASNVIVSAVSDSGDHIYNHELFDQEPYQSPIADDGSGGVIVGYSTVDTGTLGDGYFYVSTQKLDSSGNQIWPVGAPNSLGYTYGASTGGEDDDIMIAGDGSGGASLVWYGLTTPGATYLTLYTQYVTDGAPAGLCGTVGADQQCGLQELTGGALSIYYEDFATEPDLDPFVLDIQNIGTSDIYSWGDCFDLDATTAGACGDPLDVDFQVLPHNDLPSEAFVGVEDLRGLDAGFTLSVAQSGFTKNAPWGTDPADDIPFANLSLITTPDVATDFNANLELATTPADETYAVYYDDGTIGVTEEIVAQYNVPTTTALRGASNTSALSAFTTYGTDLSVQRTILDNPATNNPKVGRFGVGIGYQLLINASQESGTYNNTITYSVATQ